ncbi:PDZ domain-containing protein [Caldibacillus debilis]|mgnify:FL=1|uniref:PDZ domain-containing protein n=1 Tax=Caldibacillus debilis TaxID=301148 RepID=A0A150M360_9BACI|nr:PDZ domain-containing protein [Caldibacillus debilis]KYD18559.1 hypothetical protein B4135_2328 [Caldibacillus debilis]
MAAWVFEVAKGIGMFFLHPLFYIGWFYAVYLGYRRVKRERKDFHVRVQDGWFEFRTYLSKGILPGVLISLVVFAAGAYSSFSFPVAAFFATLLFSLFLHPAWLSPAFTAGTAFFLLYFLQIYRAEIPYLNRWLSFEPDGTLPTVSFLLALLLFAESYLLFKDAAYHTSPRIIRSPRGLNVGVHESRRLWMVPLVLVLPGGNLHLPLDFWPLLPFPNEDFSLLLIPYWIGFARQIRTDLPAAAVSATAKRVLILGLIVSALAIPGFWHPLWSAAAAAAAVIGRLFIPLIQRMQDQNRPFYFSRSERGVKILDIIPGSPAERMGLKIGELVTKVNGTPVNDDTGFYGALQKNMAYCRLEVVDHQGEVRLESGALYEGEHHELGILFVGKEKQWMDHAG